MEKPEVQPADALKQDSTKEPFADRCQLLDLLVGNFQAEFLLDRRTSSVCSSESALVIQK